MIGSLIEQLKKKFKSLEPLDSDHIFYIKGDDGITAHIRNIPESKISKPKSSPASESLTTPWTLTLNPVYSETTPPVLTSTDIISGNAIACWYDESVLLATEIDPLTWTAPAKNSTLYVDVYYDSGWKCVTATTAGSAAGHQYYLVGKYNEDGSITQYQHGILRITDRYQ